MIKLHLWLSVPFQRKVDRFRILLRDGLKYNKNKGGKSHERNVTITKYLLDFFGSARVKDITPKRIERYMEHRLNQVNKQGETLNPATVNREIACLKHIFNIAIRDGKIDKILLPR